MAVSYTHLDVYKRQVLMQVAFHAVIEEERGRFTFEDVCREVCEKLVFPVSYTHLDVYKRQAIRLASRSSR